MYLTLDNVTPVLLSNKKYVIILRVYGFWVILEQKYLFKNGRESNIFESKNLKKKKHKLFLNHNNFQNNIMIDEIEIDENELLTRCTQKYCSLK